MKAGQLRATPIPFSAATPPAGPAIWRRPHEALLQNCSCELCAPVARLSSSGSGRRQSGEVGEGLYGAAVPVKYRCALPPIFDHAVARDSTGVTAVTLGEAVQRHAIFHAVVVQPHATAHDLGSPVEAHREITPKGTHRDAPFRERRAWRESLNTRSALTFSRSLSKSLLDMR